MTPLNKLLALLAEATPDVADPLIRELIAAREYDDLRSRSEAPVLPGSYEALLTEKYRAARAETDRALGGCDGDD